MVKKKKKRSKVISLSPAQPEELNGCRHIKGTLSQLESRGRLNSENDGLYWMNGIEIKKPGPVFLIISINQSLNQSMNFFLQSS